MPRPTNKRHSKQQQSGGGGSGPPSNTKRARLDLRKEHRQQNKGRNVQNLHVKEVLADRNGKERLVARTKALAVEAIERKITKEEARLRTWKPLQPPPPKPTTTIIQLKGAARPASEKYPHLYPELLKLKEEEEKRERESIRNILNENTAMQGLAWDEIELRSLVCNYTRLGFAALEHAMCGLYVSGTGGGSSHTATQKSIKAFQRALELDGRDPCGARYGLILAALDDGDAALARSTAETWINREGDDCAAPELVWALAFIEYVAHFVLKENESATDAEQARAKAIKSCPEIAHLFCCSLAAQDVIDPARVENLVKEVRDKALLDGIHHNNNNNLALAGRCDAGMDLNCGEAYAVTYFTCAISLWRDARGAIRWIRDGWESTATMAHKAGGKGDSSRRQHALDTLLSMFDRAVKGGYDDDECGSMSSGSGIHADGTIPPTTRDEDDNDDDDSDNDEDSEDSDD